METKDQEDSLKLFEKYLNENKEKLEAKDDMLLDELIWS